MSKVELIVVASKAVAKANTLHSSESRDIDTMAHEQALRDLAQASLVASKWAD